MPNFTKKLELKGENRHQFDQQAGQTPERIVIANTGFGLNTHKNPYGTFCLTTFMEYKSVFNFMFLSGVVSLYPGGDK